MACLMARRRSPVFAPRDGWELGLPAGEEVSGFLTGSIPKLLKTPLKGPQT